MRYAIVSDIHANIQAWNSVLLDIRSLHIDEIICLGDIVGYGPNPSEVLESVHKNVHHIILGNHDAVVCDKINPSLFNDQAKEIILWTRQQLNNDAISFLKTLPLSVNAHAFRCTHGDFSQPAAFKYIIDAEDAMPSWQTVNQQLLFVGHTHRPAIFLLGESGIPRMVEAQDFILEPKKRFLVNVGSVGQPRDGDARANYCVLDTSDWSVFWRHIPFDIDMYKDSLKKADVSPSASYFLKHDPRQGQPPLRGILNFSPSASAKDNAKDAVEVQEIKILKRKISIWKRALFIILLSSLLAVLLGLSLFLRYKPETFIINDGTMTPLTASDIPADKNILHNPEQSYGMNQPVPGWSIHLSNKNTQNTKIESTTEYGPVFVLKSKSISGNITLYSSPVRVQPGMKLCMEALFRKQPSFKGNIALTISLTQTVNGHEQKTDNFVVKHPNQYRQNDWILAKHTFEIPAGGKEIRLCISGSFDGEVFIRDLMLYRRE